MINPITCLVSSFDHDLILISLSNQFMGNAKPVEGKSIFVTLQQSAIMVDINYSSDK